MEEHKGGKEGKSNEMEKSSEEVVIRSTLTTLVDATLSIEKVRVRSQVRQTHLALKGRRDEETDNLVRALEEIESYIDGRVAKQITSHPAYGWFSKVKGVGKENIGKVVAPIDIQRAATVSALWKFAGYSVEEGKAPKRVKGGGKLSYNSQLRSMCWRLGCSLMRANGKFYDYYLSQKTLYQERYRVAGIQIVPVTALPKKDGKRTEGDGYISEGHVHNLAFRKMIKLFLACLWLVWREAAGLPVTKPYAIDKLGHDSFIDPWSMTDR